MYACFHGERENRLKAWLSHLSLHLCPSWLTFYIDLRTWCSSLPDEEECLLQLNIVNKYNQYSNTAPVLCNSIIQMKILHKQRLKRWFEDPLCSHYCDWKDWFHLNQTAVSFVSVQTISFVNVQNASPSPFNMKWWRWSNQNTIKSARKNLFHQVQQ